MTRYAIGDVQGCNDELQALIARLPFSADRDQLYFVGDLVNRGPASLHSGSPRGAADCLRVVAELLPHAVALIRGERPEHPSR